MAYTKKELADMADLFADNAAVAIEDGLVGTPEAEAVVNALLSISYRLAALPDTSRELDLIDGRLMGIAENISTIAYKP
ncbi:hypothetical protein [Streptomyces sp. SID3343]|uniref:hypothetical protein n=1 Tax=Streptomyces sp. SID3343 TaxID=2690260 RepID=UPI00136EE3C6|nr:hypothetical protein [Streptomyces sp. SID3343]MYW00210.1 hypothetical protein [Streptomyces sp. SID3343]